MWSRQSRKPVEKRNDEVLIPAKIKTDKGELSSRPKHDEIPTNMAKRRGKEKDGAKPYAEVFLSQNPATSLISRIKARRFQALSFYRRTRYTTYNLCSTRWQDLVLFKNSSCGRSDSTLSVLSAAVIGTYDEPEGHHCRKCLTIRSYRGCMCAGAF